MPYSTQRGVTWYYDHETPPEMVTSKDEQRALYNVAQTVAFDAVERLAGLLDGMYEPKSDDDAAMIEPTAIMCILAIQCQDWADKLERKK